MSASPHYNDWFGRDLDVHWALKKLTSSTYDDSELVESVTGGTEGLESTGSDEPVSLK